MIQKKNGLLPLKELERDFPELPEILGKDGLAIFRELYKNRQYNVSIGKLGSHYTDIVRCIFALRRKIEKHHLPFVIFTNRFGIRLHGYELWRFL